MNILLIMDPAIPVPPKFYGGIERIVYSLAKEYTNLGHCVTLLAGPGSYCEGETICFGENNEDKTYFESFKETLFCWRFILSNYKKFDLIHNFGRLNFIIPILACSIKKIMSYQREVTSKNISLIYKFLKPKNLTFTGCSDYISKNHQLVGNWKTIYNFVNFEEYDLNKNISPDAPFVFLGRIEEIKGPHLCIEVAKASNKKLIIAGNIPENHRQYFDDNILPHIDNNQVKYIGEVDDKLKNELLRASAALLMLIEWDEPFGIVMVEAMACGTPVIAFSRGSVPEVVEEGITGFIVKDMKDIMNTVKQIEHIDRETCRNNAMKRFDVKVIAQNYLNLVNNDKSIS